MRQVILDPPKSVKAQCNTPNLASTQIVQDKILENKSHVSAAASAPSNKVVLDHTGKDLDFHKELKGATAMQVFRYMLRTACAMIEGSILGNISIMLLPGDLGSVKSLFSFTGS
ncbi:hypothetical protein JHK85_003480 [Glycine max]|nr:hypothetical protein JHK85_003480 [Glycine max]